MRSVQQLYEQAIILDSRYKSWMEQHNMPVSTIFLPWSPLNNPVYSVLITALVMLILVPAIISVIIGTIFKSNIAFVAVAVYAAIIILAFLVTLIYALMSIIKWLMKNGR